jgi:D-alanine-D-alanine ligase
VSRPATEGAERTEGFTSTVSGTVTVAFGGPSPEHDISILTGLQAEAILRRAGTDVQAIYWDRSGAWYLVPADTEARDYLSGAPASATPLELKLGTDAGFQRAKKGLRAATTVDLGTILTCFHGGLGESGGAQALFALLGVPATGGTPAAAALGMDKLAFGGVIEAAGLPTLSRSLVTPDGKPDYDGPYIIKPRFGGSSIGIEVVGDWDTALALRANSIHLRAGAVVEPYRPDLFDVNIAFRTAPTFATSLTERPLRKGDDSIYSYAEKYLHDSGLSNAPREMPANLPEATTARIRELAQRVAELTGLTGIVRVDFLSDGEEVYVNEVNSIPGALSLFLWPEPAPAKILLDAVEEARAARSTLWIQEGEEGAALRAAGGIASKLAGLDRR